MSVFILTASRLEAVLEIHRYSLLLLQWGVGGRGGKRLPRFTSCPDNHGCRQLRRDMQVGRGGERGREGLCTPDNSTHNSLVPLFTAILARFPSRFSAVASGGGSIKLCISCAEQNVCLRFSATRKCGLCWVCLAV
jgi:hypothetical protein